jgi:Nucleotidyl transferase AbiEii toxin, Type IV TA system
MVMMPPNEPQRADDYDSRTTAAVKSVLLEIGQILGSYKGKYTVVGGAVPWLLLDPDSEMRHVGTTDVDLGLDAEALGDGEYASLVSSLMEHGYQQRENLRRFQLVRQIAMDDGGPSIDVIVDFLMPKDAVIEKNKPPLVDEFAVQRASGAELAIQYNELIAITGEMPRGGRNRVEISVCSIPALLAMKGHAIENRYKQKDAYDIYYCIRNYPEGIDGLAQACRPLMAHRGGLEGYTYIAGKFDSLVGFGPTCVRRFVEESQVLDGRTPEQWQQDAFGQVDAWLRALGLRE